MYNRYKKQLALATEEEYYLEAEMRLSADNRPGFDSQIVTLRYIVLVSIPHPCGGECSNRSISFCGYW